MSSGVWNGRPLPMVRQPYPDELISSWLARVASAYGATWSELCRDNDFPDVADHGNRPEVLLGLENLTRVRRRTIEALDLAKRFPGQPRHRFSCHPESGQAVADFCEDCLLEDIREDRDNYMRYLWVIGGVAHCHKHRRLLATKCGHCLRDLDGYLNTSEFGIRVCCTSCQESVAYAAHRTEPRAKGAGHLAFSLRGERRLKRALRGEAGETRWLGTVEDLAFLAFLVDFRDWSRWIKHGLWTSKPILKGAIRPALDYDYGRRSRSILYPLMGLESSHRGKLVGWVMGYLEHHNVRKRRRFEFWDVEPTAKALFRALDDAGREEFVWRASRWPEKLRKPVREVMHMPMNTRPGSRLAMRVPWAISGFREYVNYGKIPRCYPGMSEKLVRKMDPAVDYLWR